MFLGLSYETWKSILLGAVVGSLFPLVGKFLISSYRYARKRNEDVLLGYWYCYFYSNQNNPKDHRLVHASLTITRSFWRGYVVVEKREDDKKLVYKGTVEKEDSCILVKMKAEGDDETVVFRLHHSLHTENTIIYGLHLSEDGNRIPYCGGVLISRNRMEAEQVKGHLKGNYLHSGDGQVITTRIHQQEPALESK